MLISDSMRAAGVGHPDLVIDPDAPRRIDGRRCHRILERKRHITHLFNAMEPFSHRSPGLIGAAAEDPDCMAELICDGIHVHASAVRAAFSRPSSVGHAAAHLALHSLKNATSGSCITYRSGL